MTASTPNPRLAARLQGAIAAFAAAAVIVHSAWTSELPSATPLARNAVLAQPAPTLAPVAVLTLPDPPLANVGRPHGVAVAPDGTIYFFDQAARRIVALAPSGAAPDARVLRAFGGRRTFGGGSNDQHRGVGLAVAPGGDVLVVNGARGQVDRFTSSGRLVAQWGPDGTAASRFAQPGGLAIGADGTVYVADTPAGTGMGRVYAIGPDGRPRAGFGKPLPAPFTLQAPAGIATTARDTVLVVDMALGRIVELGADGVPIRAFGTLGEGPGELRQPAAVAVEAAGTIVVADLGVDESRLLRFAADGAFIGRIIGGTALREPVGLAVAGDGGLVVADAEGTLVWLSPDGLTWSERRDGPTELRSEMPQIVDVAAADDGAVAVLDVRLGQVIRFDALGRYAGRWGSAGTSPGALAVSPGSIGSVAAGPRGDLYIGDTANRVQRFTADGTLRDTWDVTSGPNQLNGVFQLDVDAAGAFAVTHFGDTHVQLHDAAGARLALWGLWGYRLLGRFVDPAGIALTADHVYVSDRSANRPRIQVFDRTGRPITAWGGATWGVCPPSPPSAAPPPAVLGYDELAAAPDGTIHASRYPDGIAAFTPDGQALGMWGRDPFGQPYARFLYGLAFDAAGRAYVGDRGQQAVRVFAPAPEPFWRAAWFDNRWLAGAPVTVTHVADFTGDVALPDGLPTNAPNGWSMRATRWQTLSGGAWRLAVDGRGGARAWLADASYDAWGDATFAGVAEARLPAGSWEAVVELQSPLGGAAALSVRLDAIDAVPPPTRTPPVTLTAVMPTAALPSSTMVPPTIAPTTTSTPWATPLPQRIVLPVALVGAAGRDVPTPTATPTPSSPWTPPTHPTSSPTPPTPAEPSFGGDPTIDVVAIDIDLSFESAPRSLVGAVVTTTVRLRGPVSAVMFNAEPEGIRLRAAAVDGRATGWGWAPGASRQTGTSLTKLHIPLGRRGAAGDIVIIRLDYAIPPDVRRRAIGLAGDGSQPAGRLTRSSPTFARWWLPSSDTPGDIAAFTAVLRVPAAWQSVASGAPDAAWGGAAGRSIGAERRAFRFAADDIAPHQIAVAAGPFARAGISVCLSNRPPGPSAPAAADDLDAPVPWTAAPACDLTERRIAVDLYNVAPGSTAITTTLDALAYLDRHIAPWPHARIALVGGAHNVPLDRADVVNVAAQSSSFAAGEAVARAYFGDRVRVGDWDDVWIREGFTALLARFRTHDFELAPLCECRPESPYVAGVDPADRLIARERFGPIPATCLGAAAVLDLHVRTAAAAGLTVDDAPARRLMIALIGDIEGTFDGRTITTAQLVAQLELHLADAYAAAGRPISDVAARAIVDAWRGRWGLAGGRMGSGRVRPGRDQDGASGRAANRPVNPTVRSAIGNMLSGRLRFGAQRGRSDRLASVCNVRATPPC